MVILSQRDPRWKDIKLGTSSLTIEQAGCTITCLAMMAGTTPNIVNTNLKNVNGYANSNLVIWEKVQQALPNLQFVRRVREYNNDDVANNLPALVEVDASRIGANRHWVVYIGNQKMYDPWFGNEKATSYYKPVGYALFNIKEPIQEETEIAWDWIKKQFTTWQVNPNDFKSIIAEWRDKANKIAGKDEALQSWEDFRHDLMDKIKNVDSKEFKDILIRAGDLRQKEIEYKELQKTHSKLSSDLVDEKNKVALLDESLIECRKQKEVIKNLTFWEWLSMKFGGGNNAK